MRDKTNSLKSKIAMVIITFGLIAVNLNLLITVIDRSFK